MNVVIHPSSIEVAIERARHIVRAEPGVYLDHELRHACDFLMEHGNFIDSVQAATVLRGMEIDAEVEEMKADLARAALTNVYPPLWPGLVVIGCAFGVALGFALLVMP